MASRRKQKGQYLARGVDEVYRKSMRDIRKAVKQDQRKKEIPNG